LLLAFCKKFIFAKGDRSELRNEWPQVFREAVATFNAGAVSASVAAMTKTMIYHMCRKEEWVAAEPSGNYPGSSNDATDGFIHFSTASQIVGSAAKHRAGQTGLVLLSVRTDLLGAADLRWEKSRDGELFPHLYDPLPVAAVTAVDPLPLGPDGKHIFPPLLQGSPE
jgi:uncharacterized protein (DUF952 family)